MKSTDSPGVTSPIPAWALPIALVVGTLIAIVVYLDPPESYLVPALLAVPTFFGAFMLCQVIEDWRCINRISDRSGANYAAVETYVFRVKYCVASFESTCPIELRRQLLPTASELEAFGLHESITTNILRMRREPHDSEHCRDRTCWQCFDENHQRIKPNQLEDRNG